MNGIKIDKPLGPIQDYLSTAGKTPVIPKLKESECTLCFGELNQSLEQVRHIATNAEYQVKVDNIAKDIIENRYEFNIDNLVDQLLAEDLMMESF